MQLLQRLDTSPASGRMFRIFSNTDIIVPASLALPSIRTKDLGSHSILLSALNRAKGDGGNDKDRLQFRLMGLEELILLLGKMEMDLGIEREPDLFPFAGLFQGFCYDRTDLPDPLPSFVQPLI